MTYIFLIVVLLLAVLLVCLYVFRRNKVSPDQKILNDFEKLNKKIEKEMKMHGRNMKKIDESLERIRQIIKNNDDKLKRMHDDINMNM